MFCKWNFRRFPWTSTEAGMLPSGHTLPAEGNLIPSLIDLKRFHEK